MTDTNSRYKIGYSIISIGVLIALVTAVLPHYSQSHHLAIDLLLLGFLPYAVYATLTLFAPLPVIFACGIAIMALDFYLKIPAWWMMHDNERPVALYEIPLISTAIVLITILLTWLFSRRKYAKPMT